MEKQNKNKYGSTELHLIMYIGKFKPLSSSHVFLGFTKCGQFVMSYTCQMDASEQTSLPFYLYKLQWWWFVPSKPLVKVSSVKFLNIRTPKKLL